jgi:hypothetical protein
MPRTTVFLACVLALLVAAPANAQSTRTKIYRECQDGALSGNYTSREIRDARNNIPDDIDQYSDCRDVLSAALANSAGGGGGGDAAGGGGVGGVGGSGGSGGAGGGRAELLTPSTDEDRQALDDAATRGGAPLEIGGERIVPGAAASIRNDLPSTLLVVLILLAAAAAAGAAPLIRRLPQLAGLASAIRSRVLPGRSG